MSDQLNNTRQYCQICFGNEISAFLRPRLSREDFRRLNLLTIAFGVPLGETKIQHQCVQLPNQQIATIRKQPVASTSRASLVHSTTPMANSPPKQLQPSPPAPKIPSLRLHVIHENGTEKDITVALPAGAKLPLVDVLKEHEFPIIPDMPFKCQPNPPGTDFDYLILVGNIELAEVSQKGKEWEDIEPVHDNK